MKKNEITEQFPFRNTQLDINRRVSDLVSRLTLDEKIKLLSTHHYPIERLGIREWHIGTECARGYVTHDESKPSTVFPQPIGMSSTFDTELMKKIGDAAGDEFRAYYNVEKKGGLMVWGPTVDMERDPRWGRTEEAYGEDPFLTGEMSTAYTLGLRGNNKIMKTLPTLKHFCADNNEKNRVSCSANLDPRTKHEYYYAAFKPSIVKGGAHSMMAAYNELSGVPAILNPELQTIVKDEWGLTFVVSDGGDFSQTVTGHRYVSSHAESLALSLRAGCDIMTDDAELVHASAYEALNLELLTEKDIDATISRSLKGRFMLGEFDGGTPFDDISTDIVNNDEFKKLNLRAAKEGITLLKNDGILPLSTQKIALIGSLAEKNLRDWYTGFSSYLISCKDGLEKRFGRDNVVFDNGYDRIAVKSCFNGKYLSASDDGKVSFCADTVGENEVFEYHDWDFDVVNLYSVAKQKFLRFEGECQLGEAEVFSWFTWETLHTHEFDGHILFENRQHKNISVSCNGEIEITSKCSLGDNRMFDIEVLSKGTDRAAVLAKSCDSCIVCVGNHPLQVARECYDRPDITLPSAQTALVKAAFEANNKTIELIISGYPFAVNYEAANLPAIVYTSHAGPELGNAVAAVISGDYSPAGRTPMTWYRSILDLPDILDYDIITNNMTYQYFDGKPLYPFGHGISYAAFEYSGLNLSVENGDVVCRLRIENISDVDSDEVVQIYCRMNNSRVKRPLKKLCGFKRVHIKAHSTIDISIAVERASLEFYDVTREKLCVENGSYTFMAGASSDDIRLTASINIDGEIIPPRDIRKATKTICYDEKINLSMKWSKTHSAHFMKLDGWGGQLAFLGCQFNNETRFHANCASYAAMKGKITIRIDNPSGEVIGSLEVNHTMSIDAFEEYITDISQISGVHNLYLILEKEISILDFWID